MSISEGREFLLSQLVDGELPVDQANQLLAEVFDEMATIPADAESAKKLKAMLHLRLALNPWRRQVPQKMITSLSSAKSANIPHKIRKLLSLATAVLLGGILAAGGYYVGSQHNIPAQHESVVVTPEQRVEIERAFILHESVAGPLSWYAADDSTIQVSPAQKGEPVLQPIAVILRLTQSASCSSRDSITPQTYVIVCRNRDAATIELPPSAMTTGIHLRMVSTETNGKVHLQYVLAADGRDRLQEGMSLVGRRQVGLGQTSLGQLALNDCLVNIDASAWVIGNHTR